MQYNMLSGNKPSTADIKNFERAIDFLRKLDCNAPKLGMYELENGMTCCVRECRTEQECNRAFETHDRYYDIHFILQGEEYVGLAERARLRARKAYDPTEDITFYDCPEHYSRVLLQRGSYLIVGPQEAHRPLVCVDGEKPVIKAVVKVPVSV